MKQAYLLQHVRDDGRGEDIKVIGVYGSREKAEVALERTRRLPGFADHPDGFTIDPYEVDQDQWSEGFVSSPAKTGKRSPAPKRERAA